jgi:hypothetical protein
MLHVVFISQRNPYFWPWSLMFDHSVSWTIWVSKANRGTRLKLGLFTHWVVSGPGGRERDLGGSVRVSCLAPLVLWDYCCCTLKLLCFNLDISNSQLYYVMCNSNLKHVHNLYIGSIYIHVLKYTKCSKVCARLLVEHLNTKSWALIWSWSK